MKKLYFILAAIFALLVTGSVLAAGLTVEKTAKGNVVVSEISSPAVFDFVIDNPGANESFEIYSLVGVAMAPRGKFQLYTGKNKIEVRAWPDALVRKNLGFYNFEYQLKGERSGFFKDFLLIKIVPFQEMIELSSEPISPDDGEAVLIVKNKEKSYVENGKIKFESDFFNSVQIVSLEPLGEKEVKVVVDKNSLKKLRAGKYVFSASVYDNEKTKVEGTIDVLEKSGIAVNSFREGLIVRKATETRTNVGNVPALMKIELRKNIISRLFTLNSVEPTKIERNGPFVTYTWEKELEPGESFVLETTTNYTVPFILIVLVVLAGLVVKIYSLKAVGVSKSVSFVRTKRGEFALKVTLKVKARKPVTNVQLIDSIPAMTKLYEQFGRKPDRVDHTTRRLFWNLGKLTRGETRVYSYIIYSASLNIVGRFELPRAVIIFEREGKTIEFWSNRAYFAKE